MTTDEAAKLIISRWQIGHHTSFIMLSLVMLGFPATKEQVMKSVRIYCDAMTENKAPKPGAIPEP